MKKMLIAGVLALACLTGCKANFPIASTENENWNAGINLRGSYAPTYYDVDLKPREVPVHPDDKGFLQGSTPVKSKGGMDFSTMTFGLEGIAGHKYLSLVGGCDLETSFLSYYNNPSKDPRNASFYDFKPQQSDSRGYSGSCVYDKLTLGNLNPIPFVGLRSQIGDITLGAELGFPTKEFTREYGHHRFNKEQQIGKESVSALGTKVSVSASVKTSEHSSIGLELSRQQYNFGLGKVSGTQATLMWVFHF